MSYNVFPQLSGITWNIKKRPTWNTTKMLTAAGNEFRTGYRQNPLTEFDLSYSYLSPADKLSMEGFFNGQNGALTPFYFDLGVATNAASDNSVNAFVFGIGDGSTTTFTLIKPAGTGSVEPVGGVNGTPLIYKSDWQGTQLQYATPRTNLLLYSQAIGGTDWGTFAATATLNNAVGPSGATTATLLTDDTTLNNHSVQQNIITVAGNSYVFSVDVKAGTLPHVLLLASQTAWWGYVEFDVSAGAYFAQNGAGNPTFTYGISPLPNGYYRCWMSFPITSASAGTCTLEILESTATGGGHYTGTGTGTIYVDNAQCTVGTIPSSYITTTSTTATVTDYTLTGNQVAFTVAPLLNAILTWTGNFYYLVRFSEDVLEFNQLMNQMYELQECKLVSVR